MQCRSKKKKIILRTIWVKLHCLKFNCLNNAFEIENCMSLWWNFIKILYGQYGSDCIVCIVSWSEFARNIIKLNIDQSISDFDKDWSKFTKWAIWINTYCPWLSFFRNISSSKKELLMETYVEYLKGQYGSLTNMVQRFTRSEFATNIAKVNIDWTICEFNKDWSKFTKWALWINLYCPWLKIFQKYSK